MPEPIIVWHDTCVRCGRSIGPTERQFPLPDGPDGPRVACESCGMNATLTDAELGAGRAVDEPLEGASGG